APSFAPVDSCDCGVQGRATCSTSPQWGEVAPKARVRGKNKPIQIHHPLTPTLSPLGRGSAPSLPPGRCSPNGTPLLRPRNAENLPRLGRRGDVAAEPLRNAGHALHQHGGVL